jgi:glucosamine--fructose-6-phosphate aminotransferase (isomerizing)
MYYMEKEIQEQPKAIIRTLEKSGESVDRIASEINPETIYLVGSGSSYYCGRVFSYIYESLTGKKVISCYAMEFATHIKNTVGPKDAVFMLSQSGESLDIIKAAKGLKNVVAVTNTQGSTITKFAKYTLLSRAGKEKSLPSTKTFTSMLSLLALYAIRKNKNAALESKLFEIPEILGKTIISCKPQVEQVARRFAKESALDIIGDGINYPVTLESALKMKESALMHAQGMPVAEYFHGHISLASEGYPIILICPGNEKEDTTGRIMGRLSAINAYVPVISFEGENVASAGGAPAISIPKVETLLSPFLSVPVIQSLAFKSAVMKGLNPDISRELSKVVLR